MSWYVKSLILHSSDIRSIGELDSDSYISLLVLENKIKELVRRNLLSSKELEYIINISNTKSITESSKLLCVSRITLSKALNFACKKIAYYLGGDYTNPGYIDYIKSKYNLSIEEENKLLKFVLKDEI